MLFPNITFNYERTLFKEILNMKTSNEGVL